MPCLLALLAFFFPRFVMVVIYIFSDYLQTAFKTALWPLLGFIFLPYTTLAYAFAMHQNNGSVSGIYLIIVIVAFLMDIGSASGAEVTRRRRVRVVE
jgi:hypothetical protein